METTGHEIIRIDTAINSNHSTTIVPDVGNYQIYVYYSWYFYNYIQHTHYRSVKLLIAAFTEHNTEVLNVSAVRNDRISEY